MLSKLYVIFCILRLALTLFPEIGYIHPDEFFQAPEIVYGDLLEYEVEKTWEFTSPKPIRSIVFPYFIVGTPTLITKLNGLNSFLFRTAFHPYILIVLPRLFMCFLSFIIDFLIYKICIVQKQIPLNCLLLYSSSYVTLTYMTRTLSNSLETLYFALLIYFTLQLYERRRNMNCLINHFDLGNAKLYFIVGVICSTGMFNRPTFIIYSLFSMFVLFIFCNKRTLNDLLFLLSFLLGALSVSLCLSSLDTFYYRKIHYSEVEIKKMFNGVVFTPLNFLLYNSNSHNLSQHGLHPWYLHFCVNIPLLFSVLGLFMILKAFSFLSHIVLNFFDIFKIEKYFFFYSFYIPLGVFSLIPHQEPRFIIPLLIPLILNCSKFLTKRCYIKLWCLSNVLCLLFYGFLHQGGVYLSLSYLHIALKGQNNTAVIFYKTYMPPRFLLSITKSSISVHDFAGVNEEQFVYLLSNITQKNFTNIFIVIPFEKLDFLKNIPTLKEFTLTDEISIFPHLSTESPPSLDEIGKYIYSNKTFLKSVHYIKNMFSIHILKYKQR